MRDLIRIPRISMKKLISLELYPALIREIGLIGLLFITAFLAVFWRIDQAPDLFTDEILYTRLGIRVIGEGALVWDSGRQIVIHPPLFFLLEGAYLRFFGGSDFPLYQPGDIYAAVHLARGLNAILAGLTAGMLYLLGKRLANRPTGLLIAALFVIDPFGVRINRRAMLETLAMLLILAGLYLALIKSTNRRRAIAIGIGSGLFFGAALLTKEITFTAPLAVLISGAWDLLRRRWSGVTAVVAAGLGFLSYWIFPAWVLIDGDWERYLRVKSLALQRLFGLIQISGWNRPGVSLFDFLQQRLVDYGSSYFLLALGFLATLILVFIAYQDNRTRFLVIWGGFLYPFYAFVALFGSGNDQFFYFLLLPALILTGYTLGSLSADRWQQAISHHARLFQKIKLNLTSLPRFWYTYRQRVLLGLLILVMPYNLITWWNSYGVGVDHAYQDLATFVRTNVPAGEKINASGDAAKFQYFFPYHQIADAGTIAEAQAGEIRYFVLAPKDVQARYGRLTPELANWITSRGEMLFATSGDSYGDIYLYRLGPAAEPVPGFTPDAVQREFPAAELAFVEGFIALCGLWLLLWSGVAGWLWITAAEYQPSSPDVVQEDETSTSQVGVVSRSSEQLPRSRRIV
jgi:hypothetical protein